MCIRDSITIVVGYMKEQFDYLVDKFGVNLIVDVYKRQSCMNYPMILEIKIT